MRDKKRIGRILKLIKKIWKKNPDLRLMQLLTSAIWLLEKKVSPDYFYVEDSIVEKGLEKHFNLKEGDDEG